MKTVAKPGSLACTADALVRKLPFDDYSSPKAESSSFFFTDMELFNSSNQSKRFAFIENMQAEEHMAFDEDSQRSSINYSRMIGYSIIGGVLITLATALIPNTTLIGAANFGYPFPWLSQLLYPIGSPLTIIWSALLVNIIVWAVLAFVVIIIFQFLKSR